MKSLGIIITSDTHAQYIGPMVRAAHRKGLAVHMHLAGAGVRLVPAIDLDALARQARITICRESVESHHILDRLSINIRPMLAQADEMVRLIESCDRHVVF